MALLSNISTAVEPFSMLMFEGAANYNNQFNYYVTFKTILLTFIIRYICQGVFTAITNRIIAKYCYIEYITRTVLVVKLKIIYS